MAVDKQALMRSLLAKIDQRIEALANDICDGVGADTGITLRKGPTGSECG
jgi:hypothetical protein